MQFEKNLDELSDIREQLARLSRLLRCFCSLDCNADDMCDRPVKGMADVMECELSKRDGDPIDPSTCFAMLESHIEDLMEDIDDLIEDLAALKDDYNTQLDRRMNDTLYFLTMVTTAIVPLQTLSGIYGMNFVDEYGNPAMPELTWQYGYEYFWLVSFALSGLILLVFKMMHWM